MLIARLTVEGVFGRSPSKWLGTAEAMLRDRFSGVTGWAAGSSCRERDGGVEGANGEAWRGGVDGDIVSLAN